MNPAVGVIHQLCLSGLCFFALSLIFALPYKQQTLSCSVWTHCLFAPFIFAQFGIPSSSDSNTSITPVAFWQHVSCMHSPQLGILTWFNMHTEFLCRTEAPFTLMDKVATHITFSVTEVLKWMGPTAYTWAPHVHEKPLFATNCWIRVTDFKTKAHHHNTWRYK